MALKQENMAEKELIVGSIKVLHGITGGGIEQIKSSVNSLQTSLSSFTEKQNNYWAEIANDNIITPGEKQTMRKEWDQIQQTYTAIIEVAEEKGLDTAGEILEYKAAYTALYNYLFTSLKVFDNMQRKTVIPNVEVFTAKYNTYYECQSYAQSILAGTSEAKIRTISSLSETGTEGEIVMYNMGLYKYVDGEWIKQTTENYLGKYSNNVPENPGEDCYFLAASTFTRSALLVTSKGYIKVQTNKLLAVKRSYVKGYIYLFSNGNWNIVSNRNDWRYIVALNDLIESGSELSNNLQAAIKSNADVAVYLGIASADISNPQEGDYYVYSSANPVEGRKNGYIYKYAKANGVLQWIELNPTSSENEKYYMSALVDICTLDGLSDGYFNVIFAKALFSAKATIEALSAQIITLKNELNAYGRMQSSQWNGTVENGKITKYGAGFCMTGRGDADLSGDTHIGGTTTIEGVTSIKGNLQVTGTANIGGNSSFSGALNCGELKVKKGFTYTIVQDFGDDKTNDFWNFYNYFFRQQQLSSGVVYAVDTIIGAAGSRIVYNGSVSNTIMIIYSQGTMPVVHQTLAIELDNDSFNIEIADGYQFSARVGPFTIEKAAGEALAMYMENLPTDEPTDANRIYVGENNVLKISGRQGGV